MQLRQSGIQALLCLICGQPIESACCEILQPSKNQEHLKLFLGGPHLLAHGVFPPSQPQYLLQFLQFQQRSV